MLFSSYWGIILHVHFIPDCYGGCGRSNGNFARIRASTYTYSINMQGKRTMHKCIAAVTITLLVSTAAVAQQRADQLHLKAVRCLQISSTKYRISSRRL